MACYSGRGVGEKRQREKWAVRTLSSNLAQNGKVFVAIVDGFYAEKRR